MSETEKKLTAKIIIEKNLPLKSNSEEVAEKTIDELLKLTHVRLDRIGLTHIANLDCLTKITNLYLQHNSIEKIENVDVLLNLKFLCVSHNKIKHIGGIKDLKHLGFFDVSSNLLSHLDFDELPKSLIILDIRENDITCNVGEFTDNLPKLKQLNGVDLDDDESESSSSNDEADDTMDYDVINNNELEAIHESRMSMMHDELFEIQTPRRSIVVSQSNDNNNEILSFDDVKAEIETGIGNLIDKLKTHELEIKHEFDIRDVAPNASAYSADDFITKFHETEQERLLDELQKKLKHDQKERDMILEEFGDKNELLKPIEDLLATRKTFQDGSSNAKGSDYTIVARPWNKSPNEDQTKRRTRSAGHKTKQTGLFTRPLVLESPGSNVKNKNERPPLNYNYKKKTKDNLRAFESISSIENDNLNNLRLPMPPVEAKKLSILPKIRQRYSVPSSPVMGAEMVVSQRIRTPGARPIDRALTNAFEISP